MLVPRAQPLGHEVPGPFSGAITLWIRPIRICLGGRQIWIVQDHPSARSARAAAMHCTFRNCVSLVLAVSSVVVHLARYDEIICPVGNYQYRRGLLCSV